MSGVIDLQDVLNRVVEAAIPLMAFQVNGLGMVADKAEEDLSKGQAMVLSTIQRRRADAMVALFRAANDFRNASDAYQATLKLIDPTERRPI